MEATMTSCHEQPYTRALDCQAGASVTAGGIIGRRAIGAKPARLTKRWKTFKFSADVLSHTLPTAEELSSLYSSL
jgi:hypothetical protein